MRCEVGHCCFGSLQLFFKNGHQTPVFGDQHENCKPNKEQVIPNNTTITKVQFYKGGWYGDSSGIGAIGLYDQNGNEFAKFGPVTNKGSKTLVLNKN